MAEPIRIAQYNTGFSSKQAETQQPVPETRILPDTPKTRLKQDFHKTTNAFLDYPIKGLKGDINSNFYEFLTMGIVPYLTGSAMFMVVFNCVNKYLESKGRKIAADRGYKFALGVVLYGLFKTFSKNLVTKPVKHATGVDTELPYENIVYPLPKEAGEAANIDVQYQQRKVYDSKEFFRKDLLDRAYFDKVAQKLGLGTDLNDSITETTPIIQNIVATTNTAKSLSSYCWAAVGVCLAAQDSWTQFFNAFREKKHFISDKNTGFTQKVCGKLKTFALNTWNISKEFVKSFAKSCKELWQGKPGTKGYMKHAGKGLVLLTTLLTSVLTLNTITRAKNMAKNKNKNTIDNKKESAVL